MIKELAIQIVEALLYELQTQTGNLPLFLHFAISRIFYSVVPSGTTTEVGYDQHVFCQMSFASKSTAIKF